MPWGMPVEILERIVKCKTARGMAVHLGALGRSLAALLLCGQLALPAFAGVLPPFSWDRVPVAADLRTDRALSDEEARFMGSRYSFVVLEKGQGLESLPADKKHTEDGFLAARQALKAANPDMPVLYYWNSLIYYPLYRSTQSFDQQRWCMHRPRRQPAADCWHDPRGRIHFERSNREFQEWWHRSALSALDDLHADGLFLDAIGREYDPDLAQMLGRLTAASPQRGGKLVLVNLAKGLQGGAANYLSMPGIDGFMIEHFGVEDHADPQVMKADLLAVQEAGKRGKVVLFKAWPDFVRRDAQWFHQTREKRPAYQSLVEQARREITFPLACFLAVAQPHSYFQYSWGYAEPGDGNLIYRSERGDQLDPQWYPELMRALGAPKGDAEVNGFRFRRSFAHADVDVDLATRVGTIRWAGASLPRGEKQGVPVR
jgi:hypothetical protein